MRRSIVGTFLYVLNGPIVWALHLTAIYGAQAIMCSRGMPAAVPTFVLIATMSALIPLAAIMAWPIRASGLLHACRGHNRDRRSYLYIARGLSLLSAVAIVWAGATTLWLPACSPLR